MELFSRQRSTDATEGGDGQLTTLSVHHTSQGVVRYRRWPGGRVSVELLDEPATLLASVRVPEDGAHAGGAMDG